MSDRRGPKARPKKMKRSKRKSTARHPAKAVRDVPPIPVAAIAPPSRLARVAATQVVGVVRDGVRGGAVEVVRILFVAGVFAVWAQWQFDWLGKAKTEIGEWTTTVERAN